MSAIVELLLDFVVEPLLSLFPGPRILREQGTLCLAVGVISVAAIALSFRILVAAEPPSEPAWASNLLLFFFLLSVTGFAYTLGLAIRQRSVAPGLVLAAAINAAAIGLPFWLGVRLASAH